MSSKDHRAGSHWSIEEALGGVLLLKACFGGLPFCLHSCKHVEGMNDNTTTSLHPTFLTCWRADDINSSQHCVPSALGVEYW